MTVVIQQHSQTNIFKSGSLEDMCWVYIGGSGCVMVSKLDLLYSIFNFSKDIILQKRKLLVEIDYVCHKYVWRAPEHKNKHFFWVGLLHWFP